MKRFSFTASDIMTLLFVPVAFLFSRKKRPLGIAIFLCSLLAFSGCFQNYFKVISRPGTDSLSLAQLGNSDKYFLLHLKNGFYNLKNISANGNLLEGDLQTVSAKREKYIYASQASSKTYKSRDRGLLFSEVHLYAQGETSHDSSHISIPLTSISKINVYQKDNGRTIASYVLGSLGIYAGISLILTVIVLASCNCPQVYTFDGNQYNFKSGVFSGAIYSSLEKTDYLPLENLQPVNGKFSFKLANNQREEQFINQVQLIKVSHKQDEKVLLDRLGKPHTYSGNVVEASTENMPAEVAAAIRYPDGNSYMFNTCNDAKSPYGSVILNFRKDDTTRSGKLIVHAKNTFWSGYIFDQFAGLFGNKYQTWIAKKDKANRQDLETWQKEQSLPLMVYVETANGWSLVDYFPFTGNTASRDMIMQIPANATGNNVRIKIESAYMFWELDNAVMDFSPDDAVGMDYINTSDATLNGKLQISQVGVKDEAYTTLKENEALEIAFNYSPNEKAGSASWFLSSTGYYHSTKTYSGSAQVDMLKQFRKQGAFNEYSLARYKATKEALAKGINLRTPDGSE